MSFPTVEQYSSTCFCRPLANRCLDNEVENDARAPFGTKAPGNGAEGKRPACRVNVAIRTGRQEQRVGTTGTVVVDLVAKTGFPATSIEVHVGPGKDGPLPSSGANKPRPPPAAAASSSGQRRSDAHPPLEPASNIGDLERAGLIASNAAVDAVLAEMRARRAVQAQLADCLRVPDFDTGSVHVERPRFWFLNALFRDGDAFMWSKRPRAPGELPDEVRLRFRVAAHDVQLVCGFTYNVFRGGLTLTFGRFTMDIALVIMGGLPSVRCLEVKEVEDPHVTELCGVSSPFRKFVSAVVKKAIRQKKELMATLVTERYKEVLQNAISDVDLTAVLMDKMLGPRG